MFRPLTMSCPVSLMRLPFKLENHLLILALTGTLFLVATPRTAQATGCHVPERPVLARSLSWERWQQAGYSPLFSLTAPAPAAIVPLPCQGETATLRTFAGGLTSVDYAPGMVVEEIAASGKLAAREAPAPVPSPVVSRLDRPPRRGSASRSTQA
jgi:hypothetical protein